MRAANAKVTCTLRTGGGAFIDTDSDFVVVSADDGAFGFSNASWLGWHGLQD